MRYLEKFKLEDLRKLKYDVVIIGTGIAGLYTALCIDERYKILLMSKDTIETTNTYLAQGGIATAVDNNDKDIFYEDTVKAGTYHNDIIAAKVLIDDSFENTQQLINLGISFDTDEEGNIEYIKEGGHSRKRILHSKDATGREIIETLDKRINEKKNVTVLENTYAIDVLTTENTCIGVLIKEDKGLSAALSKTTVIATGGLGQVYKQTTNSRVATGDGLAIAHRAGAKLLDMEFVQFHPTALYDPKREDVFLISEAVRGEGAILRNHKGEPFMTKYHELRDLAPRDVVSKSIATELIIEKQEHVFLDITHRDKDFIKKRFPNIFTHCLERGIDISKEYIPVNPVQHYIMGGIRTDTSGRTNINNLFAAGEVACTGVHGANRLASNSLLEGLVFAKRVAKEINCITPKIKRKHVKIECDLKNKEMKDDEFVEAREKIREVMKKHVFILRKEKGLQKALKIIKKVKQKFSNAKSRGVEDYTTMNMIAITEIIIESALKRTKSLGAHVLVANKKE
ncbi:MAG: L-aspartate oxidase [Clostridiales bacterium]|nr:L-aspartate oxidase [Clostridiales bacterium]